MPGLPVINCYIFVNFAISQYEEIDAYGLQQILSYRQKKKQSRGILCFDRESKGKPFAETVV